MYAEGWDEKMGLCITIKFTENIFFKPTLNAVRKRHPSPYLAIEGPTVFLVKMLPS